MHKVNPQIFASSGPSPRPGHPSCCNNRTTSHEASSQKTQFEAGTCRFSEQHTLIFHPASCINYRTPYSTVRSISTASSIVSGTAHLVYKPPTHFRQPEHSLWSQYRFEPSQSMRECKLDELCTFLGFYAASSGNSLSTFRDNLSFPSSRVGKSWPFQIGPTDFPEKSVTNYHYSLRNSP
jgi:hypothetical protein